MKKLFLFLAFVELTGALILFMKPEMLFFSSFQSDFIYFTKLYAIAAFCLGAIAVQCYKYFEYTAHFRMVLLIFLLFHALISFHLYALYDVEFINHMGPSAMHGIIAIAIIMVYYAEKERFKSA